MSECSYWWRTGDIQWCDRKSDGCTCAGWEENCDLRKSGSHSLTMEHEMTDDEVTLATKKRTKHPRKAA